MQGIARSGIRPRHLVTVATLALAFAGILLPDSSAGGQSARRPDVSNGTFVFRDISVLPMDSEVVRRHYTVVVTRGKIDKIGAAGSVATPQGATVIDGRGRFLMPGLADMHTHVDRPEMLPLFLQAGVTTVLNMGLASPEFVTLDRYKLAHGAIPGPRVYAAFLLDGPGDPGPEYVPVCARDARDAVDRAKLVGYDFIKVYDRLQPDIYAAILDEAKKQHLAVVGHIPPSVGLERSLASGQVMVAHAEEFYKTYFNKQPDESRIAPAVEITRRAGAYVTPNLSFFAFLTAFVADPAQLDSALARPEMRLVPPDLRAQWMSARPTQKSNVFVPELATLRHLTFALSAAGVPLLAGTDTPITGMVPGISLDDDLDQLVIAGLTPFQALVAATRTPGEFIRRFVPDSDAFGTIAPGKRADLIMLSANPLQDVRNVRHPLGVMVGGRWLTAGDLRVMVEQRVPEYDRVEALATSFKRTAASRGVAAAIHEYRRNRRAEDKLPENIANTLGYRALATHKVSDAVELFAFNAAIYPDSWNAFDSLGEAYAAAGLTSLAIVSYRHSLALNPRNAGAAKALGKLRPE
jgi:cytosine/adenosine deaminase-related metal-dependent hydrolase